MAELASDASAKVEIKELALTEDRLQVAAEKIKDQHVSEQVPGAAVQEHCGDELPCVGVANSRITERQIRPDEPRLGSVNHNLRRECDQIKPNEREKNDPLPLRPSPRVGRRFSAGQAHCVEDTANAFPLSF